MRNNASYTNTSTVRSIVTELQNMSLCNVLALYGTFLHLVLGMGISEWLAIPELFQKAKTESRIPNPMLV